MGGWVGGWMVCEVWVDGWVVCEVKTKGFIKPLALGWMGGRSGNNELEGLSERRKTYIPDLMGPSMLSLNTNKSSSCVSMPVCVCPCHVCDYYCRT
jgi:hypothetical protein